MAKGNNRSASQPRATFQQAGGSTIKFRHPYLSGALGNGVDTIDVSSCVKLDGRFFEADANQDSAHQTVLIDGSVVTITNSLLNGTITMPVIKTTGLVGKGDFLACLQLIRSTGDSVGGLLWKTDKINGIAITRLYYGVTVQHVPDDVSEGNNVPEYTVKLLYAGWIEASSATTSENLKKIWAVGNARGLSAYFSPYDIQNSVGGGGTKDGPITGSNYTNGESIVDDYRYGNALSDDGKKIDDTDIGTNTPWIGDSHVIDE